MRTIYCAMAVVLLCGCQANTTALRNPFATPNRVPPPATRVLQPGAAQPYYPGDPLPSTPTGSVFPPAAVGTPVPAFQPVPGSLPPGGWNSPPQSSVTPTPNVFPASAQITLGPATTTNEPPVQVNVDQQNLRFASFPNQEAGQELWNPPQAAVQTASFQEPVNSAPREVRIRAVKPPSVDSDRFDKTDGFRPQGSRLINRSKPIQEEDAGRFGFDPQYQWLRGQIQFSQATGQWHLRYLPEGRGPDQFGGQVLIENPHLLGGLQPGDYVQVRGRLTRQPSGAGIYAVSIVQRQRVQ